MRAYFPANSTVKRRKILLTAIRVSLHDFISKSTKTYEVYDSIVLHISETINQNGIIKSEYHILLIML